VDAFFDSVRVLADDETLRANRLALLNSIRALFLETADISQLQS
jgi:glycyl-tRNA synthetase beta chain